MSVGSVVDSGDLKKVNSTPPLSHPSTRGSGTHILSVAYWRKRVWNMSLSISLWKLPGIHSHAENPFNFLRTNIGQLLLMFCAWVFMCVYDWRVCMRPDPGKQYWHGTIRFNGILPLYNIVGAFSSRRFCFTWIFPP